MAHTEAGLSSTPCVKAIRGEHFNVSVFLVLRFAFFVKPVFELIGKEAVVTGLTKWRIAVNNLKLLVVRIYAVRGA